MAQAQTPQEKADIALNKMWPGIVLRMDEFLSENGRYYQGIQTPIVIPANGVEGPVDKNVKPTDQQEDWNVFDLHGNIPDTLPCAIEIFIHDGPLGRGYTFFGSVTDQQGDWIRAQGNGPYSQTFPWMLLKTLPQ